MDLIALNIFMASNDGQALGVSGSLAFTPLGLFAPHTRGADIDGTRQESLLFGVQ